MVFLNPGQIVQAKRAELKLSRERLAAQAGVSTSLITRMERDGHIPRADRLAAIARALDVSVSDLFGEAA